MLKECVVCVVTLVSLTRSSDASTASTVSNTRMSRSSFALYLILDFDILRGEAMLTWYCSNYYNESSGPPELCDWCQTDDIRSSKHGNSSSKKPARLSSRSEYSSDKMIKKHDREEGSEKGKSPTGAPSPRTSGRRYKLLKDVMC
ncbi:hypothetical protein Tco_1569626 [Tanacetum coccineum]